MSGSNNEKRLFPSLGRPREQDQQQTIRPGTRWALDVTAEDDQLLTKERIFGNEFHLVRARSMRVQALTERVVGFVHWSRRWCIRWEQRWNERLSERSRPDTDGVAPCRGMGLRAEKRAEMV